MTVVKQKRKELKSGLVESIRECVDEHDAVYVFAYDNMRTSKFKDIRTMWADSRFFLGKNRIIQKALGEDAEDAYRPSLDSIAADLTGQVGLLFTSRPQAEVLEFFKTYGEKDFPRAGFVPSQTITVPAGRLTEVPHTMAEFLQKLGMPVRLDKGVVVLPYAHDLCKAGEAITPDQGKLLKYFGHELAVFKLKALSCWIKNSVLAAAAAAGKAGGKKKGAAAAAAKVADDGGGTYQVLDAEELKATAASSGAKGGMAADDDEEESGGKVSKNKAALAKKLRQKKPAPKGRSVGKGRADDDDEDDDDEDDDEDAEDLEGMSEDD